MISKLNQFYMWRRGLIIALQKYWKTLAQMNISFCHCAKKGMTTYRAQEEMAVFRRMIVHVIYSMPKSSYEQWTHTSKRYNT